MEIAKVVRSHAIGSTEVLQIEYSPVQEACLWEVGEQTVPVDALQRLHEAASLLGCTPLKRPTARKAPHFFE
jgi:hypothetical protein